MLFHKEFQPIVSILLTSSMFCRQGTHTQRGTTQLFTTILLGTMVQIGIKTDLLRVITMILRIISNKAKDNRTKMQIENHSDMTV